GRGWAVLAIVVLAVFLISRNHRLHRKREEVETSAVVFNLRKIKDSAAAAEVTSQHAGIFLGKVEEVLGLGFDGLFRQDRQTLKSAREGQRKVQHWSNIIAANIFKVFRLLQRADIDESQRYVQTMSALQEISESLRDIVVRAHLHVANNHSGLLAEQKEELDTVRAMVQDILSRTSTALREGSCPDCDAIGAENQKLRILVNDLDASQLVRIKDNASKTRLSILYYSLVWDSLKIAEQTTNLLTVFEEQLRPGSSPSATGNLAADRPA
ncbi:MAG: inorganic phosphate transporter, partial [Acidobacteriota bacterium]